MFRRTLAVCVIVGGFLCGSSSATLIVQPQTPTPFVTSGTTTTTVVFDLIVENSTPPGAAMGGRDLIYDFNTVSIEFCTLDHGLSFAAVGASGIEKAGGTDNADWLLLGLGAGAEMANTAGGLVTLDPGDRFLFGTVSVVLPINFVGSFNLTLNRTLDLNLNGVNSTTDPPTFNPENQIPPLQTWIHDPAPPYGKNDPNIPGFSSPASYSFSAIPEPSPVILIGLVACLFGVRRHANKR